MRVSGSPQNTAESFPTLDAAVNVEFVLAILDQLVLESLVITLNVIVLRVLLLPPGGVPTREAP